MYYTVGCDVSGASVFWMHNKSRIMLLPFMLFFKKRFIPCRRFKTSSVTDVSKTELLYSLHHITSAINCKRRQVHWQLHPSNIDWPLGF